MAEKNPERAEAMAKQLRAKMSTQRRRTSRTFLLLLLLAAIPLAFLAWWYWPRGALPRLDATAFDAVAVPGEALSLHAQLTPEEAGAVAPDLGGAEVYFAELALQGPQGEPPQQVRVRSTPDGVAAAGWKAPAAEEVVYFQASYTDPRGLYRREDRARLFTWKATTPLLLVELDALAAGGADAWAKAHVATIPAREAAGKALQAANEKRYQIVYIGRGAASPVVYRKMRVWLEAKAQEVTLLPDGPVLGHVPAAGEAPTPGGWAAVFRGLKQRFRGPVVGVARDVPLAETFRAAGVPALLVGDAEVPRGMTRVAAWEDLLAKLPR
jgi:hypothetical protein